MFTSKDSAILGKKKKKRKKNDISATNLSNEQLPTECLSKTTLSKLMATKHLRSIYKDNKNEHF